MYQHSAGEPSAPAAATVGLASPEDMPGGMASIQLAETAAGVGHHQFPGVLIDEASLGTQVAYKRSSRDRNPAPPRGSHNRQTMPVSMVNAIISPGHDSLSPGQGGKSPDSSMGSPPSLSSMLRSPQHLNDRNFPKVGDRFKGSKLFQRVPTFQTAP